MGSELFSSDQLPKTARMMKNTALDNSAALGTVMNQAPLLLVGVILLYWLYDRIVGVDKMKLG